MLAAIRCEHKEPLTNDLRINTCSKASADACRHLRPGECREHLRVALPLRDRSGSERTARRLLGRGRGVRRDLVVAHRGEFTRQRYDSRSFAKLSAEIATDLVHQQRDDGVATSAIAGRANLAGEYVDFLERDIPLAITAFFAVFGSLLMLFFYDPLLGLVASAVAVPVALLNRRLMRRSRRIYRRLNDQTEVEVAVIGTGTHGEVRRHFGILGRQWVRLSDAEAASWSIVEVLAAGLAVFALWRTVDIGAEVGTIFATIAYVLSYVGGFDQIPGVLQRMASLSDIRQRLDGLDGTSPDDPTLSSGS